eukprot:6822539-Pyramimonas_sp.AAC.1
MILSATPVADMPRPRGDEDSKGLWVRDGEREERKFWSGLEQRQGRTIRKREGGDCGRALTWALLS